MANFSAFATNNNAGIERYLYRPEMTYWRSVRTLKADTMQTSRWLNKCN